MTCLSGGKKKVWYLFNEQAQWLAILDAKPWVTPLARARSCSRTCQREGPRLSNSPLGDSPAAAPRYWAGIRPVGSFASAICTKRGARERQTILCQNRVGFFWGTARLCEAAARTSFGLSVCKRSPRVWTATVTAIFSSGNVKLQALSFVYSQKSDFWLPPEGACVPRVRATVCSSLNLASLRLCCVLHNLIENSFSGGI